MSRTYIGPFGRILPILPNTQPLAPEETHAPIEGVPSKMATYQLPPPAGLQFGSDPFPGFTEPNRYDTVSNSRASHEQPKSEHQDPPRNPHREQLPSVSQLLTPGSHSSIPSSPYSSHHSSHHSPDPPEPRPAQAGGYRFSDQDAPLQVVAGYPIQGVPPVMPQPHFYVEHDHVGRNDYQILPHQAPLQVSMVGQISANPSPYAPFPNEHRQDTYIQQPRPIAPLTASAQYYQAQMETYDQSMLSAAGSSQGLRSEGNIVKPLPRLVGEQVLPGEGPCWIYEDGSICKKVIDGEEVNAQWGVTKAGKPRKRLAIACTTCREKKIKCDPAEPKCVQCEKFGRVCRFTTA